MLHLLHPFLLGMKKWRWREVALKKKKKHNTTFFFLHHYTSCKVENAKKRGTLTKQSPALLHCQFRPIFLFPGLCLLLCSVLATSLAPRIVQLLLAKQPQFSLLPLWTATGAAGQ